MGLAYHIPVEKGIDHYDLFLRVPSEIDLNGWIEPSFVVNNGIVRGITIGGGRVRSDFDASIPGIMRIFDEPEEIWLKVFPATDEELPSQYVLSFFYPARGFEAIISGEADFEPDIMTICPWKTWMPEIIPVGLTLWSPDENMTLKELPEKLRGLASFNLDYYFPLEELADSLDTKGFYNKYINPDSTECFTVTLERTE